MKLRPHRLAASDVDHELIWTSVGLATLVVVWLMGDAVSEALGACAFHAVTGWPCPSCGSTRACLAFLRGDVMQAFRWHPVATLLPFAFAAYAVYAAGALAGRWPRLRVEWSDEGWRLARALTLVVVAATWAFLIVDGR